MVRVVGLMTLRSHLLAAVAFGAYETSEIACAVNLWSSVPRDSLTIIDRGFLSARILLALTRDGTNRHWLIRTKKNQRWRVLRRLLPPRRPERCYPRAVKIKMSNYARKRRKGSKCSRLPLIRPAWALVADL